MHPVTRLFLLASVAGGLTAVSHATIASSASSPATKPPEVTTIGTVPATFSAADQAKLEASLRQFEATRQAARAALDAAFRGPSEIGHKPTVWAPPKPAFLETLEPSRGPRVRTKPAEVTSPVEKRGQP
jgi:hypothetical protein